MAGAPGASGSPVMCSSSGVTGFHSSARTGQEKKRTATAETSRNRETADKREIRTGSLLSDARMRANQPLRAVRQSKSAAKHGRAARALCTVGDLCTYLAENIPMCYSAVKRTQGQVVVTICFHPRLAWGIIPAVSISPGCQARVG